MLSTGFLVSSVYWFEQHCLELALISYSREDKELSVLDGTTLLSLLPSISISSCSSPRKDFFTRSPSPTPLAEDLGLSFLSTGRSRPLPEMMLVGVVEPLVLTLLRSPLPFFLEGEREERSRLLVPVGMESLSTAVTTDHGLVH